MPLARASSHYEAFVLCVVLLDDGFHTVHEVVLFLQVVCEEEAHAFEDLDKLWNGLAVCP